MTDRDQESIRIALGGEIFRDATASALQTLRPLTARLIVVGPVPEFPDVNFGFSLLQQPRFEPVSRRLAAPEPFDDDAVFRAAAAAAGAVFISGVTPYCNENSCNYRDFQDYHHLGRRGAERLIPELSAAFSTRSSTGDRR